jgi:hypothetical protein
MADPSGLLNLEDDLEGLPAADAIRTGVADLAQGRTTPAALLVAIGASRLRGLGLPVPNTVPADAELRLYEALGAQGLPDPYSGYNALIRELVSFERALEHRVYARRRKRAVSPEIRDS